MALFILRLKSNLQQFKYKNDKKQYFTEMLKKEKKINQKFKTVLMHWIYSKNAPPFHMYNLKKVDAYSEPCQIPKVDHFVITAFNGFKSLTFFTNSSTSDA